MPVLMAFGLLPYPPEALNPDVLFYRSRSCLCVGCFLSVSSRKMLLIFLWIRYYINFFFFSAVIYFQVGGSLHLPSWQVPPVTKQAQKPLGGRWLFFTSAILCKHFSNTQNWAWRVDYLHSITCVDNLLILAKECAADSEETEHKRKRSGVWKHGYACFKPD